MSLSGDSPILENPRAIEPLPVNKNYNKIKIYKLGVPGPNQNASIPGYSARFATVQDLEAINKLGSEVFFGCSLPVLKLYFDTSPTTFAVCEENATGKIVAYDIWNKLPNGVFMGFELATHISVRGKRLTRLFKTMDTGDFHYLGDSTPLTLKRFPPPLFGHKVVAYRGKIKNVHSKSNTAGIHVEKVDDTHFLELFKFDFSLLGMDRSKFLKEWTVPSTNDLPTDSYIATKDEQVTGYGTIRWFGDYWRINPLYANSAEIAEALLDALVGDKIGEDVYIRGPAGSRTLLDFSFRNKLAFCASEFRSYSDQFCFDEFEKTLQWSKVYALQEFWPL